jgi:hypothetical protein
VKQVTNLAEVKIAVCGHRNLSNPRQLQAGILTAAERIQRVLPDQQYHIWSCLAEGADRLITRILVKTLAAELTIVLPLPEPQYLKDFQTNESIQEFNDLKQLAGKIIEPDHELLRPHAYQAANLTLIKNCALLVAIWDGKPAKGPGGTGEMVEMSRQAGIPLLWIHLSGGPGIGYLTEERFENLP